MRNRESNRKIAEEHLRAFFLDSVRTALSNQRVSAGSPTVRYIVDLLTDFARPDNFYERSQTGKLFLPPLAHFYAQAVHGATARQRARAWRRLGDVALFVSGLFSGSLNRKLVDVDYYIAMGGGAYGQLSHAVSDTGDGSATFGELAEKFPAFVDVLDEVGERSPAHANRDLMRVYELWARTQSPRAAKRLRRHGIIPAAGSVSRARH